MDANEVIPDGLRDEIRNILSRSFIVSAGFYVPITLIFMKKVFKFGYENKQSHLRLFNKNKGNFNTLKLHEKIIMDGSVTRLRNEILYSSYIGIYHYFQKFNMYDKIYKDEALAKGKKSGK